MTGTIRFFALTAAATAIGCVSSHAPEAGSGYDGVTSSVGTRRHREVFEQRVPARVDVLFVLDNSGSMGGKLAKFSSSLPVFMRELVAVNAALDYHLGIVTTDVASTEHFGRLQNKAALAKPWVGRDTCAAGCDPVAMLQRNAEVGTKGSGDEKGLYAAMRALTAPLAAPGGANEGFRREDAPLLVVVVADEDDSSCAPVKDTHGGGCSAPVTLGENAYFARFFRGLRRGDGTGDARVSAIVATEKSAIPNQPTLVGCLIGSGSGLDNTAIHAERYLAAVEATGGSAHSICAADFTAAAGTLAREASGGSGRFALAHAPAGRAVVVRSIPPGATPVELVAGTDYDYVACRGGSVENAVVLRPGAGPTPGAQVEVEYDLDFSGVHCP